MINQKINIFVELKFSTGEFHVVAPIIWNLKNINPNIECFFIFNSPEIFNKISKDYIYFPILKELGNPIVSKAEAGKLLLKNYKHPSLIFSCYTGLGPFANKAKLILLKNKVILFPHAYALNDLKLILQDAKQTHFDFFKNTDNINHNFKNKYKDINLLLLNSKYDIPFWTEQKSIPISKIHVIGALGYSKEWLSKLQANMENDPEFVEFKKHLQNQRKNILITTRGIHDEYLSENNYKTMLQSLFEFIKKHPNFNFIIKLHPRQTDEQVYQNYINELDLKNTLISHLNTFSLLSISDCLISFWSSATQDACAMNIPAYEYHIHHKHHPQLLLNRMTNELVSFYTYLNFAQKINDFNNFDLERTKKPIESIENFFSTSNTELQALAQSMTNISTLKIHLTIEFFVGLTKILINIALKR